MLDRDMVDPTPTGLGSLTVGEADQRVPPYAYYALAVLTAAGFLNFADRQIVSILAQSIKADLHLSDAQLGFLLGTAFAIFYAIAGVAMGRIADAVPRTRLMGGGLALWSGMTALAGAATSFGWLGLTRTGVGLGEATANPCSHSLLSQYFPARLRAAAIGTYLAGAYLGGAGALLFGGLIVQHWSSGLCRAVPIAGACGISGWKAAFVLLGAPGIPVALLVAGLREPKRPPAPNQPFGRLLATEFGASLPPFTLACLYGLGGWRALLPNLSLMLVLIAAAAGLSRLTGDLAQWASVALGVYAVATWAHVLRLRDRPLFALTYGCPTFTLAMTSSALLACTTGAVSAWAAPYAMRTLHMRPAEAGAGLALIFALAASSGVALGGLAADRWKRKDPCAPVWIALISLLASLPAFAVMLMAVQPMIYLMAYFAFALAASAWAGGYAALAQDLVAPRMRGVAAASFALLGTVVGAGVGPYWVGKVSTLTGSLTEGLVSIQALAPFTVVVLLLCARRLRHETAAGRIARAEAAGEAR